MYLHAARQKSTLNTLVPAIAAGVVSNLGMSETRSLISRVSPDRPAHMLPIWQWRLL